MIALRQKLIQWIRLDSPRNGPYYFIDMAKPIFLLVAILFFANLSMATQSPSYLRDGVENSMMVNNEVPDRLYSIGKSAYRKRPVVLYVAIDTKEPNMLMAIDKEVAELRELCAINTDVDSAVIISSEIGRHLTASGDLSIQSCINGHWVRKNLDVEVRAEMSRQISLVYDRAWIPEVRRSPLILKDNFELILRQIFRTVFPAEKYSFLIQIKSHGQGSSIITSFSPELQKAKTAEQLRALGKMGIEFEPAYKYNSELGSGELVTLENSYLEYQERTKYLPNDEKMAPYLGERRSGLGGNDQPGNGLQIGISEDDLANFFALEKKRGLDTLFLIQESCNATFFKSATLSTGTSIRNSVYNYYRASGSLDYHNFGWRSDVFINQLKDDEIISQIFNLTQIFEERFPEGNSFESLVTAISSPFEPYVIFKKKVDSMDPNVLLDFLMNRDLIRHVHQNNRPQWAIDLLQRAFERRDPAQFTESQKRTLFGHLLNPFYFQDGPYHEKNFGIFQKCTNPSATTSTECLIFAPDNKHFLFYVQVMDYMLQFFKVKSLREIQLNYSFGKKVPIQQFWILDKDTFFNFSGHSLQSMFTDKNITSLDWGFFNRVSQHYDLGNDYSVDSEGNPYVADTPFIKRRGWLSIPHGESLKLNEPTRYYDNTANPFNRLLPQIRITSSNPMVFYTEKSLSELTKETIKLEFMTNHSKRTGPHRDPESTMREFHLRPNVIEIPKAIVYQATKGRTVGLLWSRRVLNQQFESSGFTIFGIDQKGTLDRSFGGVNGWRAVESKISSLKTSELLIPANMILDSDENIYVLCNFVKNESYQTVRVYKFDPRGQLVNQFGKNGFIEIANRNDFNVVTTRNVYIDLKGNLIIPVWRRSLDVNVQQQPRNGNLTQTSTELLSSRTIPAKANIWPNEGLSIYSFRNDGSPASDFGGNGSGYSDLPHQVIDSNNRLWQLDANSIGEQLFKFEGKNFDQILGPIDVTVAFQADGKFLIQAQVMINYDQRNIAVRLTREGLLDHTFGQ